MAELLSYKLWSWSELVIDCKAIRMKVFLILTLGLFAALSTVTTHPVDLTVIDVFDELDDFSLMNVLDYLEINDLVMIASMSPRNRKLIMDHYIIPEFGVNKTKLRLVVTDDLTPIVFWAVPRPYDYYFKHRRMLPALRVLCPIASDLKISLHFDYLSRETMVGQIASYADRYCADVPQSLKMTEFSFGGDFQFALAKSVDIKIPHYLEHFNVAEAFPSVEKLTILVTNRFTLAQHLPNLTHFQLNGYGYGDFDLKAFAEQNPQIRSAELRICGRIENIDEVNQLFPHLETLSLQLEREEPKIESFGSMNNSTSMLRAPVDLVRFRNVTKFTLDVSHFYETRRIGRVIPFTLDSLIEDKLTAIVFDQLESFKYLTEFIHGNVADHVDYILRYNDVKILDVGTIVLEYPELGRLVDALPKLEEITFATLTSDPTDLIRLMAETHLQTVNVIGGFLRMAIEMNDSLIIPHEWHKIDNLDDKTLLTFKRN